ncbi:hypothetical protein CEXT_698221 [Caerostris extrusa]|uniref:Uncharacterized protein n=1 Tax=Caerostris extrusa TaxID=172846 RepID=A0AAV4S109_CAEEX|nr:hypothetical protein CEXT_698221 [Caerostris extrusa]
MLDKLSHFEPLAFQRNLLHLTQPRKEENGGQREKETQKASGRGKKKLRGRNGSGSLVTDSVHLVRTESAVTPPSGINRRFQFLD